MEAFFSELQNRDQPTVADELESVLGIVLARALHTHGHDLEKTLRSLAATTAERPTGKLHRFGRTFEPAIIRT
jgi:hypothetical protein